MGLGSWIGKVVRKVGKAIGKAAKKVGKALWKFVKQFALFIATTVGKLLTAILCVTGVTTALYQVYVRIMKAKNRDKAKIRLTDKMILFMKPYFDQVALGQVTLIDGARLVFVSSDTEAVTLGNHIYIRKTWGPPMYGECSKARMKLLLHELVHVRQHFTPCEYLFGFVSAGYSYDNNALEKEAVAFAASHELTLYQEMSKNCVDLYD